MLTVQTTNNNAANEAATAEQKQPVAGQQVVLPTLIKYLEKQASDPLIPDVQARASLGRTRYQTELMTHNGRDPVVDAYQELLDALMYLTQAVLEQPDRDKKFRLNRSLLNTLVAATAIHYFLVERDEENANQ